MMAEVKTQNVFSKDELLRSEKYKLQTDVLNALLDDEKKYTIEETDKLIEKFMKGKVK